jgi:hypothetical protein
MKTNYKLENTYLNSRRHNGKPFYILAILFAITFTLIIIL